MQALMRVLKSTREGQSVGAPHQRICQPWTPTHSLWPNHDPSSQALPRSMLPKEKTSRYSAFTSNPILTFQGLKPWLENLHLLANSPHRWSSRCLHGHVEEKKKTKTLQVESSAGYLCQVFATSKLMHVDVPLPGALQIRPPKPILPHWENHAQCSGLTLSWFISLDA